MAEMQHEQSQDIASAEIMQNKGSDKLLMGHSRKCMTLLSVSLLCFIVEVQGSC